MCVFIAPQQDLKQEIAEGRFQVGPLLQAERREYPRYRPLRERREDIPLLAATFSTSFTGKREKNRRVRAEGGASALRL